MQLPLFTPESNWRPPSLADLPSWEDAKRVAVDTETCDPFLKELGPGVRRPNSYVVGYSFAIEGGPSHYVPLRHYGGDNVDDPLQALAYLRAQAASFTGELVGMNLAYDLDWLAEEGVEFRSAAKVRDVMIAESLIYELHRSYSLKAICERRGLPPKDEALLIEAANVYGVDPKGGLWQLPARYVGAYGDADAVRPLDVLRLQEKDIAAQDLQQVWDLESDLLPVLVRMRRRGVRIDWDRLAQVETWSLEQERQALERVRDDTGVRINVGEVWRAGALLPALRAVGIDVGRTEKTGAPKIDKALLGGSDHPVLKALAWARKVNKLRTTFAESIRRYATNGRIHPTFRQMIGDDGQSGKTSGARFGRMSCVDPNLQQQPSRDEFAAMWRSIYLPDEGKQWASCDYSQQECRWPVHYACLLGLEGAEEMARRYAQDPTTDNHAMVAELTGLPRKSAKTIMFGIMYGEGGYKLCADLGLPTARVVVLGASRYKAGTLEAEDALRAGGREIGCAGPEGQRLLDTFDEKLPFLRKLSRSCSGVAANRGYIRTAGGRRCRFPVADNGGYDWTHKALNRLIQGSSADQTKRAMIEADRAGHFLQLQVHDELTASVANRKEAEGIAAIMREALPARAPFKVDVEVGPSWGEAK